MARMQMDGGGDEQAGSTMGPDQVPGERLEKPVTHILTAALGSFKSSRGSGHELIRLGWVGICVWAERIL